MRWLVARCSWEHQGEDWLPEEPTVWLEGVDFQLHSQILGRGEGQRIGLITKGQWLNQSSLPENKAGVWKVLGRWVRPWARRVARVCVCSVAKLGPALRDPTRLLCAGNFQGKNTGVGRDFFLQGIFWPRDHTCASCTGGWILYLQHHLRVAHPTARAQESCSGNPSGPVHLVVLLYRL